MSSVGSPVEWAIFGVVVLGLLLLDLLIFNREAHKISLKESAVWSIVWVGLALLFNVFVYIEHGAESGTQFLTAYLIEKSLSVDNLFVFLAIFNHFRIPSHFQHRVLFWGVVGALVMRALFIAAGVALLTHFAWLMYVFALFLVYTGIKLGFSRHENDDPSQGVAMRLAQKYLRTTPEYNGQKFFKHIDGRRFATPLFVVLVVIEFSDVLFAFDSVPAVLAISKDPFIVYSSNVFAILGLRALYFLLADVLNRLHYLGKGLAVVLVYIGIKMGVSEWLHVPPLASLGVIAAILTITVFISIRHKPDAENAD